MTIGNGNIRAGVAVAPTTNDQRMGVLSNRCGQASQLGKVAGLVGRCEKKFISGGLTRFGDKGEEFERQERPQANGT